MTPSDLTRFMQDSLVVEEDSDEGLDLESLYGLYGAWCGLQRCEQAPKDSFLIVLSNAGIHSITRGESKFFPGLWMVGQAARAYVMGSTFAYSNARDGDAASAA